MAEKRVKRKLTAILSADVKGYSRLMGEDEISTMQTLKEYREVMTRLVQEFEGRVIDSPGDNILAEFGSVVDALECAVKIQKELQERNSKLSQDRRMEFRMGVNLGDVIDDEGRIYGDGVNVVSRIEGLAEGGGICISGTAFDQIGKKLPLGYQYLGEQDVKNIEKPVRVYKILTEPEAVGKLIGKEKAKPKGRRWAVAAAAIVVLVACVIAVWNSYMRPDVEPASIEQMAYPLPDKPSIAVLPFANMSGDANQEYLADGITENIITALSKVPEVFVIARNSVFTYKGKPVQIRQVSEDLGVQYVLGGSVQKSNGRLRITAQLIDATKGHHLWAERFDRELKDIFAVQDEVTLNILSALRVEFTHGEQARVQETTDNLEAWSYVVQGVIHFESFTKDDNAKAQELLERAVQIDPEYSYAWAILGWTHWIDATYGYNESSSKSFKKAVEIAQKAMEMDDKQPDVHALMGGIYLFQKQYDKAIAEGERAIALAPNVACNKAILAQTMLFAGNFEGAITLVKSAMRLNPIYPSWYLQPLAMAYAMIGEHEKAIALNEELLIRRKEAGGNIIGAYLGLAASSIFLGREEDAKAYVKEILELGPNYSLERFQNLRLFKDKLHMESNFEALRRAGLPEHPPLSLPDKPSIAVLPFVNRSDGPEQEYFSDGLTEEIITGLSKIPELFVIARNSSFTYKGKPVKVQQVSKELGVRYVLEGSVRKEGNRVRITAQLIDAIKGYHIWSERYDRDLKDILALQEDIMKNIMFEIDVKLTEGEQVRYWAKRDPEKKFDLAYWQKWKLMYWHWNKATPEGFGIARQLANELIDMDPTRAEGYALIGSWHIVEIFAGISKSVPESIQLAEKYAQKALQSDETSGRAREVVGWGYSLKRQHDLAIAEMEKWVALEPNGAEAHINLGRTLLGVGRIKDAIRQIEWGIRLDPYPNSWCYAFLGMAYSHGMVSGGAKDLYKAIELFKKALEMNPNNMVARMGLIQIYSYQNRMEEARSHASEALRIIPDYSLG